MLTIPALLLQVSYNDSGASGAVGGLLASGTVILVILAISAVMIVAGWKVFAKAGQPGWGVLIPIYNFWLMLKIAGKPGWWLILMFVPIVNIVISLIVHIGVAKSFGQSAVFGIFLLFLIAPVGWLMLGFGSYQYRGSAATEQ
jgi:hypothetical protein